MTNGPTDAANVTSMVEKIDAVVTYFLNLPGSVNAGDPLESMPFPRLFNETVWTGIAGRISVWANLAAANYEYVQTFNGLHY